MRAVCATVMPTERFDGSSRDDDRESKQALVVESGRVRARMALAKLHYFAGIWLPLGGGTRRGRGAPVRRDERIRYCVLGLFRNSQKSSF
jgi:hypothetical protein